VGAVEANSDIFRERVSENLLARKVLVMKVLQQSVLANLVAVNASLMAAFEE
jgi:hypothetical protein